MRRIPYKLYWGSLRLGLIVGIPGWVVGMIGMLTKNQTLLRVGMAGFFALFSLWGLANGGAMLWAFLAHIYKHGLSVTIKDYMSEFWWSLFYSILMLVLLFFGLVMLRLVLKSLGLIN